MNKEYIEREVVIEKCNKLLDNADSCPNPYVLEGVQIVRDLVLIEEETRVPSADVKPIVHGEWIPKEIEYPMFGCLITIAYTCSSCGTTHKYQTNYCPYCGAKMDGGNK